jgi:hypothetical protein
MRLALILSRDDYFAMFRVIRVFFSMKMEGRKGSFGTFLFEISEILTDFFMNSNIIADFYEIQKL